MLTIGRQITFYNLSLIEATETEDRHYAIAKGKPLHGNMVYNTDYP
jgi:hypothetical protein